MMHEKMSEEALEQVRERVAVRAYIIPPYDDMAQLLAHIAALTAERDRLRDETKADMRAMWEALGVMGASDTESLTDAVRRVVAERDAHFTLEEVERAARSVAAGAMTEEEIADLLAALRK